MKGLLITISLFMISFALQAEQTPAPIDAAVYFISPAHGETVTSPFKVRFGLSDMGVAPAGVNISKTGHHHLLIDLNGHANQHSPVPKDEQHLHFGNGQTETVLDLASGKHTLQLIVGDHNHIPHKPAIVSRKIIIYVK